VTPDIWDFIRVATAVRDTHIPPVSGGWLDQSAQFLSAYSAWSEMERAAERILKERANGR
jgi:hypothetical protein